MARIFPSGWRELAPTGAAAREIETLAQLADGLPDDFTVYHGVRWTRVQNGYTAFGEVDFVVVGPYGQALANHGHAWVGRDRIESIDEAYLSLFS